MAKATKTAPAKKAASKTTASSATEAAPAKAGHMTDDIAIQISTMNKWYGDFHVLRDIDLTVYRGERIVICGPSGSGKVHTDPLHQPAGRAPEGPDHR